MIRSPFALLRPFEDRLSVVLLTKEDRVHTDAEIAPILGDDRIASLHQVHGNRTITVDDVTSRTEQADGLITKTPDLWITSRSADCQTFLAYEPALHVLGILHAGWRGIVAEAIPAFFQALEESFHADARNVYVAAGPSLCQQCADFSDPARELPNVPASFVRDGKYVDLQGAATAQLLACGVQPDRFERSPDCTRCSPSAYWTYRGGDREEVRGGWTNVLAGKLL